MRVRERHTLATAAGAALSLLLHGAVLLTAARQGAGEAPPAAPPPVVVEVTLREPPVLGPGLAAPPTSDAAAAAARPRPRQSTHKAASPPAQTPAAPLEGVSRDVPRLPPSRPLVLLPDLLGRGSALDPLRPVTPAPATDAPSATGERTGGIGPRLLEVPHLPVAAPVDEEPPVDHRRYSARTLDDGRVELSERPRVETPQERRQYIRTVSTNRVHTTADETSRGMPWLWGGEPLTTGEGDRIDYAARQRLLDETRERRVLQAAAARRDAEQIALAQLGDRLDALWRDPRNSLADRRRLLFELWDECDPRMASGRAARTHIEAFVRERLPRGSRMAFTPEELARLNYGRSIPFAPYR
jgi:hypothetical protein